MATEQELLQRIEKLENELTQLKQDMSHINRKYIDKHRFIIEQDFQNYVNDISIWLVAHFILQNPNQQTFFIEMLESEDLDLRGESFVQNTFEYLIDFLKSKNSVFDTSPLEQAIERSATRLGKKYPVQPLDE